MDDLTQKEKILTTLFESQKKTGEIAKALGYATEKGIGKYNVVGDALKYLESAGFIKSKQEKVSGARGPTPTVYYVIYEIPNLQRMWDEYSQLHPTMQKNDKIISMLVEKHFWLIDYGKARQELMVDNIPFDCDRCLRDLQEPSPCEDEQQRQSCLKFRKENPEYIVPTTPEHEKLAADAEEFLKKYSEKTQDELALEFKNRLRMSPYFFKVCLTNTPEELKEQLTKIYSLTLDAHLEKHPFDIFTIGNEPEAILRAFFDKIFEVSVFQDITSKEASKEAEEYILETNKRKANVLEDIERLNIRTYHKEPQLLQWEYEKEWGTRKPLKSVKFEIDFKKIKQLKKLNNMSELNNFLIENQFSAEEIVLSQLLVGGLFQGIEQMRLKDIMSGLKEKGVTHSDTFVLNTLEKLIKTKRQDGGTNPVMSTPDLGISWNCLPTYIKEEFLHR